MKLQYPLALAAVSQGVAEVDFAIVEGRLVVGKGVGVGMGLHALDRRCFRDTAPVFCFEPQHSSGPSVKYDWKPENNKIKKLKPVCIGGTNNL